LTDFKSSTFHKIKPSKNLGIAWQGLRMDDELAALAVLEGGGNADLEADLWTTPALQAGFDAPIYPVRNSQKRGE